MNKDIIISTGLPTGKLVNVKFLYVVIDSDLEIHYEFNNKGHIVLPIHWNEMNPFRIYENLPQNLIRKCASEKKNIVGVLQLWIYYTKRDSYARIKAIGILQSFKGNRVKALFKLIKAVDDFCIHNGVRLVEAETNVIPEKIMKRIGFSPAPSLHWLARLDQMLTRRRGYVKHYEFNSKTR